MSYLSAIYLVFAFQKIGETTAPEPPSPGESTAPEPPSPRETTAPEPPSPGETTAPEPPSPQKQAVKRSHSPEQTEELCSSKVARSTEEEQDQ